MGRDTRLNTLYGCPEEDGLTRRQGSITIKRPFVSFIAGTPKEWLTSAVGEGEIMGGFINRFLFVDGMSEKNIPFPEPPNDDNSRRFIAELTKLIEERTNVPMEMKWSDGARKIYGKFYDAWRGRQFSRPEEIAAITNRITHHVVKIGMVYSALEGQSELTEGAIATAIEIGDYLEQTALTIFGDAGVSSQGRIEKMILTRLETNNASMVLRELRLALGGKTDSTHFNQALGNLERADMVRIIPPLSDTKTQQKKMVFLLRNGL